MQIITHWTQLVSIQKTPQKSTALFQSLLDYLFQSVNNPTNEEKESIWQESVLFILGGEDNAIYQAKSFDEIKSLFHMEYRNQLYHLFHYPEYTEPFLNDYLISLSIYEDSGSGVFLLMNKSMVQPDTFLETFIGESNDAIHQ